MRLQPLHCLILCAPANDGGGVAAKASELKASTATVPDPGRATRSSESAVSPSKSHPDDPDVVARARGAVVAEKAKPKAPAAERGRPQQPRGPPLPLAFSIPQFCEMHSISTSFFFKLQRQGRGPRTLKLGARTLISAEAASAWRAEREADTAAGRSITAEEDSPTAA